MNLTWAEARISNSFWKGPKHTLAMLWYIFIQNSILSSEDSKTKLLIHLENTEDTLYPVVSNICPRLMLYIKSVRPSTELYVCFCLS